MGREQAYVSLAIAMSGHDMMIGIQDHANKCSTDPEAHPLLASANDQDTRQHAPDCIAVDSSNSSCRCQVVLLSLDLMTA